ncbi:hypothetical protein I6A60_21400 [Frankia sp. AgB1.9]|uniref:hypothetical protein n=1 Tax=unclassified Frankia TaxID=2632575 RepID=UPI001933F1F8|nr:MULTISPECIES: hypothetical protein [unclassified Frankia]MBL7487966.1 hypothetical protein [Frankia sp. AgW1.1]MBL7550409.1 hypothetical protein [Frankia sp. AgB1.9]MBL7620879.1 hypothetical protein [Frankia sp. AgB1.8]
MELLGYSTIPLTTSIYTHVMPETQRDAVAKLGCRFDGDQDQTDRDDTDDDDTGPGGDDAVDGKTA